MYPSSYYDTEHIRYPKNPDLFNLHADYIMQMLGWRKHKLESRLPREISITSDIQMIPLLWKQTERN